MKGSRFSEKHIIGLLRAHEVGLKTAAVCRRHGFAEAILQDLTGSDNLLSSDFRSESA
jgi:hypothetical protein